MSEQNVSYFNTLIFTIVTGVISLCILGVLFFEFGQKMIYFIIAFEVGVFILIGYCIYKIVSGNNKLAVRKNNYSLKFNECPDYYTKQMINGETYCVIDYISKDRNGLYFMSRLTPTTNAQGEAMEPPKTVIVNTSSTTSPTGIEKIPLYKLERDEAISSSRDKCKLLYSVPKDTAAKYVPYNGYSLMPWTYMHSRCESFT
jgi:hypothetical protein